MSIGRMLVVAGLLLVALGAFWMLAARMGFPLGRLPGDVVWKGRSSTLYFPWVTCLLLSVLGSLVLWVLSRRQ